MSDGTQAWDRLPGEPTRWYRLFVRYYLAGGLRRSVRNAYLQFLQDEVVTAKDDTEAVKLARQLEDAVYSTPPSQWIKMSVDWEWHRRAGEFDAQETEEFVRAVQDANNLLKKSAVEAVRALITSLSNPRSAVQAAKEILDRAGIPAVAKQEVVAATIALTADDLAAAATEVEKWERLRRESA